MKNIQEFIYISSFDEDRKKIREIWKNEGVKAWDNYKKTGRYLSNDEVIAWMDKIISKEINNKIRKFL